MSRPHLDDEALSACLDGEATDAERAHLDACSSCQAQMAVLDAVATAVGRPVIPPPPAQVDAALARAVAGVAMAPTPATGSSPRPSAGRDATPPPRRGAPSRWLVGVAGVAAAALVVGGVAWLARAGRVTSSAGKEAASSPAVGHAPSTVAAAGLGDQSDAAMVSELILGRLGGATSAAAPAAAPTLTTVPALSPNVHGAGAVCFAQTQAAVGAAAGRPDSLRYTAALQWRGQPAFAVVLSGPTGLAGAVMRAEDCSLLTVLPF